MIAEARNLSNTKLHIKEALYCYISWSNCFPIVILFLAQFIATKLAVFF